jgi:hypothetical protein
MMAMVMLPELSERPVMREYDFQHRVAAALLYYGSARTPPFVERSPPGTAGRMDVCVETDDSLIIVECKTALSLPKYAALHSRRTHPKQKEAVAQGNRYAKSFREAGVTKPIHAFVVVLWDDLYEPMVTQVRLPGEESVSGQTSSWKAADTEQLARHETNQSRKVFHVDDTQEISDKFQPSSRLGWHFDWGQPHGVVGVVVADDELDDEADDDWLWGAEPSEK